MGHFSPPNPQGALTSPQSRGPVECAHTHSKLWSYVACMMLLSQTSLRALHRDMVPSLAEQAWQAPAAQAAAAAAGPVWHAE